MHRSALESSKNRLPPHAENTVHHFLHHSLPHGFVFDPFSPKNGLGTFKNGVRKMSKNVKNGNQKNTKMLDKNCQNCVPKIALGGAKTTPK